MRLYRYSDSEHCGTVKLYESPSRSGGLQRLMMSAQEFYAVIERDEDGVYVGEVPQLKACYSQGETIDELMTNIREVVEMCLEELRETETIYEKN